MSQIQRDLMRVLLDDVVDGAYAPGSPLPSEADLARTFAVSREDVRASVRGLARRGVVGAPAAGEACEPGPRGAIVRDARGWDVVDHDVLVALARRDGGVEILAEWIECRALVEVEAARLAALRAGVRDLEAMADALLRMERSLDHAPGRAASEYFHEADVAFHRAVVAGAGNRVLDVVTGPLQPGLLTLRWPLGRPDRRAEVAIPEHRRILTAIAANDADGARAAMADHFATVGRYLTEIASEEHA